MPTVLAHVRQMRVQFANMARRRGHPGVPAVRGNAAAQELDARLTAGETPLGRLGVPAFWTPARRDLVMQLPTV